MSRKLTDKEQRRKDTKNFKDIHFSEIDLLFIDTQIINFFDSKNLTILSEVDSKPRSVPFMIATPERWKVLREGDSQKKKGTHTETTKKSITPLISLVRGSVDKIGTSQKVASDLYTIRLAKKLATRTQYLSKNIDEYLNKKYKDQYQVIITKIPVVVKVNYTANLYATKMEHLNKLIEFFLGFKESELINTGRNNIIINFGDSFSNESNVEDFTDEQRNFQSTYEFSVSTQIIPEFDIDKLPTIRNLFTPITITVEESIVNT